MHQLRGSPKGSSVQSISLFISPTPSAARILLRPFQHGRHLPLGDTPSRTGSSLGLFWLLVAGGRVVLRKEDKRSMMEAEIEERRERLRCWAW
jgi:hypothetical protein